MRASIPSTCTRSGFAHTAQELANACEHAELMHGQRFRACREGVRAELGLGPSTCTCSSFAHTEQELVQKCS